MSNNTIESNVEFNDNKLMCCAMPYSKGWKAYIDGKETKVYVANLRHMGIDVPAGNHNIEFKYKNNYLIYGSYISLFGIVILTLFVVMRELVLYKKNNLVEGDENEF